MSSGICEARLGESPESDFPPAKALRRKGNSPSFILPGRGGGLRTCPGRDPGWGFELSAAVERFELFSMLLNKRSDLLPAKAILTGDRD